MIEVATAIIGAYGLSCAWLSATWWRIPYRPTQKVAYPTDFKITVIIPVRNEAPHIQALLEDLERQLLPKKHFEVIVIDDASTDSTAQIVRDFQATTSISLQLLTLPDTPTQSPKKRAILTALTIATGELIITTDGDCRIQPLWLETFAQTYLQTNAQLISGPVSFLDATESWGNAFQTIEFASLIGTGACLLEAGTPTMCNGANLAYTKTAFEAVGGFEGIDHVASGDDEFLLQKISKAFPQQILFLKNKPAIVYTHPQPTWQSFKQQRIRWAGKWAVNKRIATMLAAVFVFIANLTMAILLLSLLISPSWNVVVLLGIKMMFEFVFLITVLIFLRQRHTSIFIPLVQILYPFYVIFFGIVAQQKKYIWKGRDLQ